MKQITPLLKQSHLVAIAFIASTILFIYSCKTTHPVQQPGDKVSAARSDLMRGKQLTILICGQCHTDPKNKKLTGMKMEDLNKLGDVRTANLTNDPVHGIGRYSDQELRYLLRTGIKRDGKMAPYMEKPNLSDADVDNIIAFLRSNDEMVQPSQIDNITKYNLLGKAAMGSQKPLPYPISSVATPSKDDKIAYGKYLVYNVGCYDCHSASPIKSNVVQPESTKGYMGGGYKFTDENGKKVRAANITPCESTGLGNWTEHDFGVAVREGIQPGGALLHAPMPKFKEFTDADISALFAYVKSIPKIHHEVDITEK